MKPKKPGETCELGGQYCCLYHLKNKLKIRKGSIFPECDFAGVRCEGLWYFLKEIKEKTFEQTKDERERRRKQLDRGRDKRNLLTEQYKAPYTFRHKDPDWG